MAEPANIVEFQKPRLPWDDRIGKAFEDLHVSRSSWKALVEAVYPSAKTVDAVVMALSYCKARQLDPFKKPVHIVPMWSSTGGPNGQGGMVETVWPGISELRTTAFRTKQYAGCDECQFGPMKEKTFEGVREIWENRRKTGSEQIKIEVEFPEWAQMTVYRVIEGQRVAFAGPKVYWLESYASISAKVDVPNTMWADRPIGQLEKCAEAAALRRAFPEEIGNQYAAEEMEGRQLIDPSIQSVRHEVSRAINSPPPAPRVIPPSAPVESRVVEQQTAGEGASSHPAQGVEVDAAAEASTPDPDRAAFAQLEDDEIPDWDKTTEAFVGMYAGVRTRDEVIEVRAEVEKVIDKLNDEQKMHISEAHRQAVQRTKPQEAAQDQPKEETSPVPVCGPDGPILSEIKTADEYSDWLARLLSTEQDPNEVNKKWFGSAEVRDALNPPATPAVRKAWKEAKDKTLNKLRGFE